MYVFMTVHHITQSNIPRNSQSNFIPFFNLIAPVRSMEPWKKT